MRRIEAPNKMNRFIKTLGFKIPHDIDEGTIMGLAGADSLSQTPKK